MLPSTRSLRLKKALSEGFKFKRYETPLPTFVQFHSLVSSDMCLCCLTLDLKFQLQLATSTDGDMVAVKYISCEKLP